MNLLVDDLPESVLIDGTEYPINTDYRYGLRVVTAFEDNELIADDKTRVLLENIYPIMPDNIEQALLKASDFLNCGQKAEDTEGKPRVYSFSKDAPMIYAGFKQLHGIDLQTASLHWWVFVALFMAVIASQDTPFGALVTLRERIKTGKASKEERAAARSVGEFFDLPETDDRTLEEREIEEEFNRKLEEGRRRRDEERKAKIR